MKIAWFTPFSYPSAIGSFSLFITEELKNHAEVHIYTPKADTYYKTCLKTYIIDNDDALLNHLHNYDYIIYNIGDHYNYHSDIFKISKRIPGIVILHDLNIHNLIKGFLIKEKNSEITFEQVLKTIYGRSMDQYLAAMNIQINSIESLYKFPLSEFVTADSYAVISHSSFAFNSLKKSCGVPVYKLLLPLYRTFEKQENFNSGFLQSISDKTFLIVSSGSINCYKYIHSVLEALYLLKDSIKDIHYIISGPYHEGDPYIEMIISFIDSMALDCYVTITGLISDEDYDAILQRADLFINLRFPALNTNSGTMVDQLYMGKPIIVFNHSFYSEYPDNCVIKITYDIADVNNQIYNVIKFLYENEDIRKLFGHNAKKYVENELTTLHYVEGLLSIFNDVKLIRPIANIVRSVVEKIGLMSIDSENKLLDSVSKELDSWLKK